MLSYLIHGCKRGWRWPSFDTDLSVFSFKCQLVSITTTWFTQQNHRGLNQMKQGHFKPHCHSEAGSLTVLWQSLYMLTSATFQLDSVYLTLSVLIEDILWSRHFYEVIFLGCPSSCECKEFGENQHKKILVTGEDLLTVPRNLPFDTGAVYVKSNEFTIFPFLLSVLIWSI